MGYSSTGAPLGSEFHVNTYTAGIESFPSVASDPSGNFVVVWNGDHDGSSFGVFGQRYASSGIPLGPEFPINTYTTGFQTGPRVAVDPAGNFVVVWNSTHEAGTDLGVFGQRFASSGAPLGPEFRVNTYTTNNQRGASVGFDAMGNFVIAWQSTGQDGSAEGIFGQRYDNLGVPLGGEFRVNTYTTSVQRYPSVTTDSSGNFVVVWSPYDGSLDGVFGQRYAASGAPLGTEFRANSYTTSSQGYPAVTAAGCGNFVVVWESDTQDGSGRGIFGQRFGRIVPVELMQVGVE